MRSSSRDRRKSRSGKKFWITHGACSYEGCGQEEHHLPVVSLHPIPNGIGYIFYVGFVSFMAANIVLYIRCLI